MKLKVQAPAPISREHALNGFDCGEPTLNDWLIKSALKNQASGASRCFVISDSDQHVIGFYTLSSGAIAREGAPKTMQRNMPSSLPIALIGRLAIDQRYHNKGLGKGLLRDAVLRVVHASSEIGIFAILIHALTEPAKRFYLSCGFVESPLQPMTLMMTVKTARDVLMESGMRLIDISNHNR
jgi:GNAT superfamily N-acetyltransferase